MKKGARLAVMTVVKRRFFRFKRARAYSAARGVHIFDTEELDDYVSRQASKVLHILYMDL